MTTARKPVTNKSNVSELTQGKILEDFINALNKHKTKNNSLGKLIYVLQVQSQSLKNKSISFEYYKTTCTENTQAYLSKNKKLLHEQPHGLIQHIVDTFRAMLRLLERMVNYVTGQKSSLFTKPDSELGKAAKAFTQQLTELEEFKEPENKQASAPTSHKR